MQLRTGIFELDVLLDELHAPLPEAVRSVDDIPLEAEAAHISRATRGLERLVERPRLRRVVAKRMREAELEQIGRVATLEHVELVGLRTRDLRPLTGLRRVRILQLSTSTSLESLAGIERWMHLQLLSAWNTTGLRSIDALRGLRELRYVSLSGGMYKPIRLPSLDALAGVAGLMKLSLSSVRVADRSLRPLGGLRALQRLDLPLHFTGPEFRWLEEALPAAAGNWRGLWRTMAARR